MAVGFLVFGAIVLGVVSAGAETSTGSNTRNGVIQGPPLPQGITATANRLVAPNGR